MKCIIIDLDGCLFKNNDSIKFIPQNNDREEWDKYHAKYYTDHEIIDENILEILIANYKNKYIFLTSREDRENVREITKTILDKIVLYIESTLSLPLYTLDYELLMRENNDFRSSEIIKEELINKYIKDKYEIKLAVDDTISNIKLFRKLGIPNMLYDNGYKNE